MNLNKFDFVKYLNNLLDSKHRIISIDELSRLRKNSNKSVYRITYTNGFTSILYIWALSEQSPLVSNSLESTSDNLSITYGAETFEYNNNYMNKLGIGVPNILYLDRTRSKYHFDFALVEDLGDLDLLKFINNHPSSKQEISEKLYGMIHQLHNQTYNSYGQLRKVASIINQSSKIEEIVLENVLIDIEYLSHNVNSVFKRKDQLIEMLYSLYDSIQERTEYTLIHGELGPDHVFVRKNGQPVLIDIEGAQFFDIEYEHSFMKLRFSDDYDYLRVNKLDQHRMRFYKFCLHIAYTAGPLRDIRQRNTNNTLFMKDVANYNLKSLFRIIKDK